MKKFHLNQIEIMSLLPVQQPQFCEIMIVFSYEGGDQDYDQDQRQSSCDNSFILKLHCPAITSVKWMVKLYSLVMGGLGVILSFTWICFHLYVLSMTSLIELRQQR